MIMLFIVYLYWNLRFLQWINLLGTKIKKLTLDETRGAIFFFWINSNNYYNTHENSDISVLNWVYNALDN